MPLIWHLMGIYASHGFHDFVVACGHKGAMIKEFFHNFAMQHGDFAVDLNTGIVRFLNRPRIDCCSACLHRLNRYGTTQNFLPTFRRVIVC